MQSGQTVSIQELNLHAINPIDSNSTDSSRVVIIGRPGSGKSFLIRDLIYHKHRLIPAGVIMSGTEATSRTKYRDFFPDAFIFNDLNIQKLEEIKQRQEFATQHCRNPWTLVLLDDCTSDPKVVNGPLFQDYFKNGRHWSMLFILSLQYAMDVKPAIRQCIDWVFLFHEPRLNNRRKLYENFASVIPTFELFEFMMDEITGNYTALVINCSANSNHWQDCVFFYKARAIPENFRFGNPTTQIFHEERYNPEYHSLKTRL